MKLLLDEMFSPDVAEALRAKGHDVLGVAERPDLREQNDEEVLRAAAEEGQVLVTENVRDFRPLAERWQVEGSFFYGLLFTSPRSFPRARPRLGALVTALDRYLAAHTADDALANSWEWLTT